MTSPVLAETGRCTFEQQLFLRGGGHNVVCVMFDFGFAFFCHV